MARMVSESSGQSGGYSGECPRKFVAVWKVGIQ